MNLVSQGSRWNYRETARQGRRRPTSVNIQYPTRNVQYPNEIRFGTILNLNFQISNPANPVKKSPSATFSYAVSGHAFLLRNNRSDLGKWATADPLGWTLEHYNMEIEMEFWKKPE